MKQRLNYDQMTGLMLFVFSVLLYFLIIPYGIPHRQEGHGLNPAFMPNLITLVLGGFSLLIILQRHMAKEATAEKKVPLFSKRVVITVLLFIAYMIITPIIGYLPATFMILPSYLIFWGFRKPIPIVVMTLCVPLILYWFFAKVMLVMLP